MEDGTTPQLHKTLVEPFVNKFHLSEFALITINVKIDYGLKLESGEELQLENSHAILVI